MFLKYHKLSPAAPVTLVRVDELDRAVVGPAELVVEPRRGRLIVFGSGRENPHRVTRVEKGTRYVLSFWFTCDASKHFGAFLDGKEHGRFGPGGGAEL